VKISHTLGLALALTTVLLAGLGFFAYKFSSQAGHNLEQIRAAAVNEETAGVRMLMSLHEFQHTLEAVNAAGPDRPDLNSWREASRASFEQLRSLQAEAGRRAQGGARAGPPGGPEEDRWSSQGQDNLTRIGRALDEIAPLLSHLAPQATAEEMQRIVREELRPQIEHALTPAIVDYRTIAQDRLQYEIDQTTHVTGLLLRFILIASLSLLALAGGIGVVLLRNIVQPLRRMEETVQQIAAGDQQLRLRPLCGRPDELATVAGAFDGLLERMSDLRSAELRESEEKFRGVFDQSPIIIGLLTVPDGRIVELNAAGLAAFGYTREEVFGKTLLELNLWADAAVRERHFEELRAKGHAGGFEVRIRRKNGEIFTGLYSGSIIKIGGQPYSLNSLQDITSRKQSEAALRESEEKFRGVFDQSPIIIGLLSVPDGRLVEMNEAGVAAFGYTREEAAGRTSVELGLWVSEAEREHYLQTLRNGGRLSDFEARMRRKDGSEFTVLYSGSIIQIGGRPYSLNSLQDITSRKQAEAARNHSFALTRATLESTADGILVVDKEGRIETYNQVFAGMWRIPSEVLAARDDTRALQYVTAQLADPEMFLAKVRELYEKPFEQSFDVLHFLDGRTFERYSRPLLVDGLTAGRVWSFRDITAQKRAVTALRDSEEKFRGVFDRSPIPIIVTSMPDGRILEVNAATIGTFGYTREEVIGKTTTDLGVWVDPAAHKRYIARLQTDRKIEGAETQLRNRRGETLDVLYSGIQVNIAGQPCLLNSVVDMTGRKRAEALFQDLFSFSPDAIIIATSQGIVTNLNEKALQLFGCTREEVIGKSALEMVPEDMQAETRSRLERYLMNPVPRPMGTSAPTLRARDRNGRTFPIDLSLSPVRSGGELRIVAAVRDITQQIEAGQRQRELEVQLRHSQKMESVGTLAGGIAHDFNNLLTGILGHAELAGMDLPPGHPVERSLQQITTVANRARDLVKQILTFSRRSDQELVPVRLQPVIGEAVQLLRSTIPPMVSIDYAHDPRCPTVLAEPSQIHQIIINLCTNAWHAMPERGGEIRIELHAREIPENFHRSLRPGWHAHLVVSDNGSGMDETTLNRIYDPFFTTKPVGQGTGLGLAVVHGIVDNHHGAILVHSERGRGTTFDIYLPAANAGSAPAELPPQTIPTGQNQRVLVVDDQPEPGRIFCRYLTQLGYQSTFYVSAVDARSAFLADPDKIDLAVVDHAMPVMSGTMLTQRMKSIRPDLPVLMVTGYLSPEERKAALAAGVDAVLPKPFTLSEVAEVAARLLRAKPKAEVNRS